MTGVHFTKMPWSEEAAKGLDETLRDDGELLRQQVESGIAELWRVNNHSWMITRVEPVPGRKPELVVCCYKGQDLKNVTQHIMNAAIKNGFDSIRYHTRRPGLNRLVSDLGFEYMETIYNKDLRE